MKSVIAASALATVALAANSSTTSPLIPTSNISPGCASYLGTLNSDGSLTSCLSSINAATAAFGPTAAKAADASAVAPALAQLCASTACDDSTLRSALAAFYAACPTELVGSNTNEDVITMYDSLYMISPMNTALCSKASGNYCVNTLASSAPASSKRDLGKRDAQTVLKPNAATYSAQNIALLRLSASAPHDVLCGDCSRAVQQAWIDALNAQSYAPGIVHSTMFPGQATLYNVTTAACGTDFFSTGSSVNNVGGGLAGGVINASGAASTRAASGLAGLLGAAILVAMAF